MKMRSMRNHKGHVPERTCIGCRAKKTKNELIRRVVDEGGREVRDDWGKGEGRGADVCPDISCWKRLEKPHILKMAFKKQGSIVLHPELYNIGFSPHSHNSQ